MRLNREKRLRSLLVILLLLAVLTLACWESGSGSSSSSSEADIGDEVRLHGGSDFEWVFVAVDRDAHDELMEVVLSKDEIGGNILLASGRVFLVDDGSKVLVIDRDPYIVKVRILEGPYYGRSGWVIHEAVD